MTQTRRQFLAATAAITVLPMPSMATGGDTFQTTKGPLTVHPVTHASLVLETPVGNVLIDPADSPRAYREYPAPDLILITHHHGDHYKPNTIKALMGDTTKLITNPHVFDQLPNSLKSRATAIKNGDSTDFNGLQIDAIAAYNLDPAFHKFHPPGRDNGYVLSVGGLRTYVAGDTDDIPEMRALHDIDIAFLCMTRPYTMGPKAAADAVAEFKPRIVYPYHYGKAANAKDFAKLVGDTAEVRMGGWYS